MPICPACQEEKPGLRYQRAAGVNAICDDCWTEFESDVVGAEVVLIDHIKDHIATVIKQNLDLPMGEVVAYEQRVYEEPGDLGAQLVYADWLEERGCSVRAQELRVAVLAGNAGASGRTQASMPVPAPRQAVEDGPRTAEETGLATRPPARRRTRRRGGDDAIGQCGRLGGPE